MALPHEGPRLFRCMRCSLFAILDGGKPSATLTGERTIGVPACPACTSRAWIDPHSFSAAYRSLPDPAHVCVLCRANDPAITHVRLRATGALASPARDVIVIRKIEVGLCATHAPTFSPQGFARLAADEPFADPLDDP